MKQDNGDADLTGLLDGGVCAASVPPIVQGHHQVRLCEHFGVTLQGGCPAVLPVVRPKHLHSSLACYGQLVYLCVKAFRAAVYHRGVWVSSQGFQDIGRIGLSVSVSRKSYLHADSIAQLLQLQHNRQLRFGLLPCL